ncbi:hypothetical protein K1719_034739 [Acacia pycnantha]|nr:hypothetical protein K1719_034739 [Acacia pycnantha]
MPCSLVFETIPFHRDYQTSLPKEKATYKKRLLAVLDELESLKSEFKQKVDELNELHGNAHFPKANDSNKALHSSVSPSLEWPAVNNNSYSRVDSKQLSNYNSFEGVLYCKPHFDQLFKRTGSLDKSFEENVNDTILFQTSKTHKYRTRISK